MSEVFIALDGRPLDEAVRRSLAALPSAGKRPPLTVLLSGALAQPFVFGPVQGLRGKQELLAAATAAAPSVCDINAACQVSVQGDPGSTAALAIAVETATLDAIDAIAAGLGLKVRSVRPVWAVAIERAGATAKQATMFACRDSEALIVLVDDGQRWRHASVHLPAPGDLHALLRRTAMGLDLEVRRCALADVTSVLPGDGTRMAVEYATLDLESNA